MSIFLREPKREIVDELLKRYKGDTVISNASNIAALQDIYVDERQADAWVRIYGANGELLLASGDLDDIAKMSRKAIIDGQENPAYIFHTIDIEAGSTYGSLRSVNFQFDLALRQPGVGDDDSQSTDNGVTFDTHFEYILEHLNIGKKICVQYGYMIPYGFSDQDNRSGADLSKDFNPKVHETPRKGDPGVQTLNTDHWTGDKYGYVFTITKPDFKFMPDGTCTFTVAGIGAGNETMKRELLPAGVASFAGYQSWRNAGYQIWKQLDAVTNEVAKTFPHFVCDFDLDAGEGRNVQVQSIVDFIDFDIQSTVNTVLGESEDTNGWGDDIKNAMTVHNSSISWLATGTPFTYLTPPVDKFVENREPPEFKESVGWAIFRFDNSDYVKSDYRINADRSELFSDEDCFSYYVTLQYLIWLLNWTMNNSGLKVDVSDEDRFKRQKEAKKIAQEGRTVEVIDRDLMRYRIKAGSALQGEMTMIDGSSGAISDRIINIPSGNPTSVLFTYGAASVDQRQTANYSCDMTKTNWWQLAGAAIVGVGGSIVTVGIGTAAAIGAGAYLAATAQYVEKDFVFCWSDPKHIYPHAQNMLYSPEAHSTVTRNFSIAEKRQSGGLARMLINRDCIAAILDELGGLTKTDTSGDEAASVESKAIPDVNNQTQIQIEPFFKKLFTIIKTASGGALDLYLTPDPDEPSPFTSTLLIKNRNEPPPTKSKVKYPVFNRGDGSVIEMDVSSKISKNQQLEAAVGESSNMADLEGINADDAKAGETKTTPEPKVGTPGFILLDKEKDALTKSAFGADSVSAMCGLLTKLVKGQSLASQTARKMPLMNLSMGLKIQGIEGFRFGDTLSCAMLPPQLKTSIPSRVPIRNFKGTRIIFTVTKVKHRISYGEWQTHLSSVMRFAPGETLVPLEYEADMR